LRATVRRETRDDIIVSPAGGGYRGLITGRALAAGYATAAQNQAVRNNVSSITQKRYPLRLAAIAKLVLVCAASNGSLCRLQVRLRRAVTRTSVLNGSGWSEESCWRWRIAWHSKAKPYACIGPPRFISHRWWRSVRSGGQSALQSRDQSELSMDPRTSGGYHQAGRLRALRSLAD